MIKVIEQFPGMVVQPIVVDDPIHYNNPLPLENGTVEMMTAQGVPGLSLVNHWFDQYLLVIRLAEVGYLKDAQVLSIVMGAILRRTIYLVSISEYSSSASGFGNVICYRRHRMLNIISSQFVRSEERRVGKEC